MPPTDTIPAESSNTAPLVPPVLPPDSLTGLLNTANQNNLNSQNALNTASTEYSNLLTQLGGAQGDYNAQLASSGYNTFNKELSDLNALQTQQQAGYLASLNRQNTGAVSLQERSIGEQAVSRQHGIDALLTNSLIQAKSGQINQALATVKSAIDAKYEPILAQLEAKKFILDQLTTKAAEDRKNLLDLQMKQIEKQQADDTASQNMIINASPYAPASVIALAKQAKSPVEVAQALGKYGGDYLGDLVKKATLAKTQAETKKLISEIKNSPTDIDISTLPNTATGFATKLLATAKSDKNLDASERQSLAKAQTVISQLDSLQQNIAKQNKTGFLKGKVNNFLASVGANADVGTINAQLQAVVPNLARGIYGEVGVLTDNDISNYRKTIANLTSPQDQNDAVMALTLKTVRNAIKNQLDSAANSGINVSGWAQSYQQINKKINDIEDRIGVSKNTIDDYVAKNPTYLGAIKEMYSNGLSNGDILDVLQLR